MDEVGEVLADARAGPAAPRPAAWLTSEKAGSKANSSWMRVGQVVTPSSSGRPGGNDGRA